MALENIEELLPYEDVYIFRGVSNKEHEMVPAILREGDYGEYTQFIKCVYEKIHKLLGLNGVETIEYAQHFGAKTNLLDFSHSYLVALFFACYGDEDKDGKLFILNVTKYQRLLLEKEKCSAKVPRDSTLLMSLLEDFYEHGFIEDEKGNGIDYPIVLEPSMKFDRVRAQKGLFLFWGTEVDVLEKLIDKENVDFKVYEEVIISKEKKKEFLSILDEKYSINKESLYISTNYIEKLFDDIYAIDGFSCYKSGGEKLYEK